MTGISADTYVVSKLLANEQLKEIVGERVYAWIVPEGTSQPYIVVRTDVSSTLYTKDGHATDQLTVTVGCVGVSFAKVRDMAELVRSTLDGLGWQMQSTSTTVNDLADVFMIKELNYTPKYYN